MRTPNHIAIIMDGNGRWAKKRGLSRSQGHKSGEESVKKIIKECYKLQIPVLSFYAFSTENWSRDKEEIDGLFEILAKFLRKFMNEAIERQIRITIMGDMSALPSSLHKKLKEVIEKTSTFSRLTVNIGLNYGGRAEIVRACKAIVEQGIEITEENISKNLYTSHLPEPDLIIRTSGEKRLSNFMIFQGAYSELYFTDTLWPDFTEEHLHIAIEDYSKRDRRFGKA